MIYAAKPQRGGRSRPTNTNNPPQDPPSSNKIPLLENEVFIPIENTAPPVPEVIVEPVIEEITPIPEPVIEIPTIKETPKLSIWNKLVNRIKKIWSRK